MISLRDFAVCALLLGVGCTPHEWDSPGASNKSTNERASATKPASRSDHKPGRQTVTSDAVVEKTKETLTLTGELIAQTKDEFVAKAKQRLAEMDRKLDEWETRSKPLSEDAQAKLAHEREVFHQRRTEMQQELDRLSDASDDAWQDTKEGATKVWRDVADAFGKAATHFESGRVNR